MNEGPTTQLLDRCRDRGFTPGARDVAALLELWRVVQRTPAEAKVVVQALCRGEQGVARKLEHGFADAEGVERAMRLRVLAMIARRVELPSISDRLEAGLRDSEPRVVREAVRAIGKLTEAEGLVHEDELIRIVREAALPEQRAAVEAMGHVGAQAALELLRALPVEDEDLARRRDRALTLLERRAQREVPKAAVLQVELPSPALLRLRCRGAAQLVADEAHDLLPAEHVGELQVRNDQVVTLIWSGARAGLEAVRTALDWGLVFPLPPRNELASRIVAGLESKALVAALQAWTDGAVRCRLAFAGGGAGRSVVWAVARSLDEREAVLRNDTQGVSWTVEVDEHNDRLVCLPRAKDERFSYREDHIPAASHPTLAALMARVGAPRRGELVWDPYCGCGAELIECSRLAADLRLIGTDHDLRAIEAARANVARAGLDPAGVRIDHVDIYAGSPEPGSAGLILTNPPMGRRAAVREGVHASLCRFVAHAATVLRPGGRLVWVTPAARVTGEAGESAGLRVRDHGPIDMSGLRVVLQEMQRPV